MIGSDQDGLFWRIVSASELRGMGVRSSVTCFISEFLVNRRLYARICAEHSCCQDLRFQERTVFAVLKVRPGRADTDCTNGTLSHFRLGAYAFVRNVEPRVGMIPPRTLDHR
jgi:hypothetical protein